MIRGFGGLERKLSLFTAHCRAVSARAPRGEVPQLARDGGGGVAVGAHAFGHQPVHRQLAPAVAIHAVRTEIEAFHRTTD